VWPAFVRTAGAFVSPIRLLDPFVSGLGEPRHRPLTLDFVSLLPHVGVISILYGMKRYYTDESTVGRVRAGEVPFAIEVFEASGNSTSSGIAFEVGRTVYGLALWRLKVHGEVVPGRFIIDDGLFVLVEPARGDNDADRQHEALPTSVMSHR
jgi:hypothetical protein